MDGLIPYSIVTIILVLVPNAIVQVFSARWNKMDEIFNRPVAIIHGLLMGTLHRYVVVCPSLACAIVQIKDHFSFRSRLLTI